MSLDSGARLGPYEIVARVGAGGMGEVFRARDTRLDRTVAVKTLPAELARNEQFRLRFQREAKAISALSHPNICALYDVGEHDGVDYLVMEFLEGETLADRLTRGPLPLKDALRIGIEIAAALERAQEGMFVTPVRTEQLRLLVGSERLIAKLGRRVYTGDILDAKRSIAGVVTLDPYDESIVVTTGWHRR